MTKKIGIVMDPIDKIKVIKDTSFAMLLAAQARGWEISYMEPQDIFWHKDQAMADMRDISVKDDKDSWYYLGEKQAKPLTSLDIILMRQDPPFNTDYIFNTYLLEHAQNNGIMVINNPQSLRDCNEKLFTTWFPQCCPPMLVTSNNHKIKNFIKEHQDVILKPLDSMGGNNIFRIKDGDVNTSVIMEHLTGHGYKKIMAQKFIPEILNGDKRILMVNGEPVPYALARIPAQGEIRGNLAAGGTGEGRPLTDRDKWICEQVGPVLKQKGLHFVGLDVIGDYLTEINVTSPTCVRELNREFNLDICGQLFDSL